jgi:hypothetical protein
MAGTYADMAQLAVLNDFINLCRVSLLKRAVELDDGTDKLSAGMLNLIGSIMSDAENYAKRMAWLIAAGNATIAAAAPAVPSEGDTQYAVNTFLPKLVR